MHEHYGPRNESVHSQIHLEGRFHVPRTNNFTPDVRFYNSEADPDVGFWGGKSDLRWGPKVTCFGIQNRAQK